MLKILFTVAVAILLSSGGESFRYIWRRPCPCPRLRDPVCGNDGSTYANMCELKCKQRSNPNLILNGKGACQVAKVPTSCACPYIYWPQCGSDGKTYSNDCELKCAKRYDRGLISRHDGECEEAGGGRGGLAGRSLSSCVCTRIYLPVCGSDGKSYGNDCELNCAKKENPGLMKIGEGQCPKRAQGGGGGSKNCICLQNYAPVCGTDHKTYGNPCQLRCAKTNKPSLEVASEGKCRTGGSTGFFNRWAGFLFG